MSVARQYKLKVVMLGDFAVGKTSLVNRYVHNIFDERYLTTLGARISKKDVRVGEGAESALATLILWDLNGEDGFRTLLPQYLKGAVGAIVVGDGTRQETFRRLPVHIDTFAKSNPDGVVVGSCNKMDLLSRAEAQRARSDLEGWAAIPAQRLFYTSAKEAIEVESMFLALAELVIRKQRDA